MPLSVRLDPELEASLQARARRERQSKSALIQRALREFLEPRLDPALAKSALRQSRLANKADAKDDWESFIDPDVWR